MEEDTYLKFFPSTVNKDQYMIIKVNKNQGMSHLLSQDDWIFVRWSGNRYENIYGKHVAYGRRGFEYEE